VSFSVKSLYSFTVAWYRVSLSLSVWIASSLALIRSFSNSMNKSLTFLISSSVKSYPKVANKVNGAAIIDPCPALTRVLNVLLIYLLTYKNELPEF